jgi:hypothetical protein
MTVHETLGPGHPMIGTLLELGPPGHFAPSGRPSFWVACLYRRRKQMGVSPD